MNKNAAKRRMVMAPTMAAFNAHLNWLELARGPEVMRRVEAAHKDLCVWCEAQLKSGAPLKSSLPNF